MNVSIRLGRLLGVVLVVACISPIRVALADRPDTWTEHWDFVQVLGICPDGSTLMEHDIADVRLALYAEKDGTPKLKEHMDWTGVLYLAEDPARAVAMDPFHFQYIVDEDPTVATFIGVGAKLTLPGMGNLLHDSGKVVVQFDESGGWNVMFVAGIHNWWDRDIAAVCAHLTRQ